jgi:hypothetical protein
MVDMNAENVRQAWTIDACCKSFLLTLSWLLLCHLTTSVSVPDAKATIGACGVCKFSVVDETSSLDKFQAGNDLAYLPRLGIPPDDGLVSACGDNGLLCRAVV